MDHRLPDAVRAEADGPVRIVRLARPERLDAVNDALHPGLTRVFPPLGADADARVAVVTGEGRAFPDTAELRGNGARFLGRSAAERR